MIQAIGVELRGRGSTEQEPPVYSRGGLSEKAEQELAREKWENGDPGRGGHRAEA